MSLQARVGELIERLSDGGRDDAARDALLCEALSQQMRTVTPYGRLCARRGVNAGARRPDDFAALPTDVFRFARVAAHPPDQDLQVFRTSATTSTQRGTHHLADLSLYDQGARAAARHALFCDRTPMRIVVLAPETDEAPDSSLSYMLGRFVEWFGTADSCWAWHQGSLDLDVLEAALDASCADATPLALLGTSFAFVHADDGLRARRWRLPGGSRIMQTGGFKGRTRSLSADQMLEMLTRRYGLEAHQVVQEYGMTELCSQLYETGLRDAGSGAMAGLWVPGWVRATVVDAEHLQPLQAGQGLLRIDDLANLGSVCAVQTSDLARLESGRVFLLGRAAGSVARGCSIAADAAMGT